MYQENSQYIIVVLVIVLIMVSTVKLLNVTNVSALRQSPIILLDTLFAFLIASIWYGAGGSLSRILSMPGFVYIAKVSYGIYLYHMFCHFLVWDVWYLNFTELPNYINYFIRLSIYLLMSVLLASLSYKCLEIPFLRIKDRLRLIFQLKLLAINMVLYGL